jgi:hypothetical protein
VASWRSEGALGGGAAVGALAGGRGITDEVKAPVTGAAKGDEGRGGGQGADGAAGSPDEDVGGAPPTGAGEGEEPPKDARARAIEGAGMAPLSDARAGTVEGEEPPNDSRGGKSAGAGEAPPNDARAGAVEGEELVNDARGGESAGAGEAPPNDSGDGERAADVDAPAFAPAEDMPGAKGVDAAKDARDVPALPLELAAAPAGDMPQVEGVEPVPDARDASALQDSPAPRGLAPATSRMAEASAPSFAGTGVITASSPPTGKGVARSASGSPPCSVCFAASGRPGAQRTSASNASAGTVT